MHNVLALVDKNLMNLDNHGIDSINAKDTCFDTLFLNGFWKKLVFLLDIDSSL